MSRSVKMWKVLEDGKDCKFPDFAVHPSWNNNDFECFSDAVGYAEAWLGKWIGDFEFTEEDNSYCYNGSSVVLIERA